MSLLFKKTATIASGQSLSAAVDLFAGDSGFDNGVGVLGIIMPAAWTAAVLTLQASDDGTTYRDVYDADGVEVTLQAAAARHIRLSSALFAGFRFLKVRSGTAAAAVNQAAERAIGLVYREI